MAATVAGAGAAVLLVGDGIDPTGGADSALSIQQRIDDAPDGAVIAIPPGAVLRCTQTVTLNGTGKTLLGPGELRFTGGDNGMVALRVTGDRSRVHLVSVTNEDDGFGRALEIAANDVTVEGCVVDRFMYGIVVAADGEWVDTRILGNRVINVVGAGGGRGSDSREGEDTGDGITVWGARATVTGNIVSALPGTDARIGIHAEGLRDIAEEDRGHSDAMVTITANVVTGPFRRCIVLEEIDHGTVVGNTVADATWWCLALIGGKGCLVSGNTVRYTRTAEDDQGRSYSPARSAVLVYAGEGHTVSGNTIAVLGAADAFVTLYTLLGSRPTDVLVADNNCRTEGEGTCDFGVTVAGEPGAERPRIRGNSLIGVSSTGVYLGQATAPEVAGNVIVGAAGAERGIFGDSPENDAALLVGNRISRCTTGISLFSQSAAVVSVNLVSDCGAAIDLFGSSGVVLTGNVSLRSGDTVQNAGANQVLP